MNVMTTHDPAVDHFARRLAYETDISDTHAAMSTGSPGFVLVDSRSEQAWTAGHILGAVHLPTRQIAFRAAELRPAGTAVVTYCWGPACNGATKAALEFAKLGYPVKEMLGGYDGWAGAGLPTS